MSFFIKRIFGNTEAPTNTIIPLIIFTILVVNIGNNLPKLTNLNRHNKANNLFSS